MRKILKLFKRIAKNQYSKLVQIYFGISGRGVECNICHYKADKLGSDTWHQYCNCPNCGSAVRQRLLWASLTYLEDFSFKKIIKNKKVLHFAPEESISKKIQSHTEFYKTADFLTESYSYDKIDYNIDISDMNKIQDNSFDSVIACDVLEHVPQHLDAMKEVYRILNKDGFCIFTVPQKDNLKFTFEDNSVTDPKEREKSFGQFDHLRIYGDDFSDMLKGCGFEVTAVDASFFQKKIVEKFVLFPPILSKHPLATNHRKVFFGQKK